jgi:hypothetical protein
VIKAAKAKPDAINFGSPGVGTPHHMAMELFKVDSQIALLHIPYKGTAGYTQDLLSGEINVGFLPVHVAQGFVSTGKLNAIAVGSAKRHPVASGVPTFIELGFKGVDVDMWYALFYPAKTPQATVERLNKETVAVLNLPEIKELLGKAGLDASGAVHHQRLLHQRYFCDFHLLGVADADQHRIWRVRCQARVAQCGRHAGSQPAAQGFPGYLARSCADHLYRHAYFYGHCLAGDRGR